MLFDFAASMRYLDAILELYVEQDLPLSEIVRRAFGRDRRYPICSGY